MLYKIMVFDKKSAKIKRGSEAVEMLACPVCGKITGVLVGQMNRIDYKGENVEGLAFDVLVWERWRCLECTNIWVEKYGIGARGQGYKARGQGSIPMATHRKKGRRAKVGSIE